MFARAIQCSDRHFAEEYLLIGVLDNKDGVRLYSLAHSIVKKIALFLPGLLLAALPLVASAHEHASYVIGGTQYDIVIGSLNEPMVVDDKTGLDLTISSGGHMAMSDDGDMEPQGGNPAIGLENSLKVEMIAGDTKKSFDIDPQFGKPGAYKMTFYPTAATPFSYRLYGEINKTPVDIRFACLPDGATATDEGEKDISAGVKQLMKGGAFGCPLPKEDLGFPQPAPSLTSLASGASTGEWGIGFGVVGIALALFALARRRS